MNKKAIVIFIIIALIVIVAITIKIYGLKNFSIFKKQTGQQISYNEEDKLRKRYEEITALSESKEDTEKFYNLYLSPESKQRMSIDQFIKNKEISAQSLEKKVMKTSYKINNITIKGDTGYIDRTMTICFDQECNDKLNNRGYKKYIKINDAWFSIMDNNPVYCI